MSLYKAWSSNRTYASSLWGKKGQAAALPQFYNKWNRERERQQGQACHTLSYPHPWVPDGREGKGASSLSQDHEPFNRVGNWFCCLAFWSNYLQLAKFSHSHGLWILRTSIYMASKQSINFNGIILIDFPIQAMTKFPPIVHSMVCP